MNKKTRSFKRDAPPVGLHRHPFVVPVITFVFLCFLTMAAYILLGGRTVGAADAHIVQLSLDNKKQIIPTRATTVEDFLNRASVVLQEGDIVEPAKDTQIDDDNFRINIYRARPITIFDGDLRLQALSAATTARSVASQAGLKVYPEDILRQEISSNVLKDQVLGDKVVIIRATPANLNLYGTPIFIRTHAKTVGELLKEKNVTVGSGDTLTPAAETPVTPGVQVFVTRFGTQIVAVEEDIPMEIQTIEDPSLSFGATAVRQAGSPGKKIVTYQLELANGQEIGRIKIQEVRSQEPVKQIVARGKAVYIPADKTVIMSAAGISSSDYSYVNYIINHENALWCPTRWQGQKTCPPYYVEKFPGAETHTSTGYGLCQSTPAIKMASAGEDWRTNPVTQMKWCHGYAMARYKTWEAAYNFWIGHHYW